MVLQVFVGPLPVQLDFKNNLKGDCLENGNVITAW